ncbi:MAG TPA: hypothetical protein VHB48_08415 [Chitinophagaceae bacterium]|nr:hypothetical protein [Chitinophagaceae bacterium]
MFNHTTIARVFILLAALIMICCINGLPAQTIGPVVPDTTAHATINDDNSSGSDDEFNLFLFVFAAAFFGAILGAAIAGAGLAFIAILFAVMFVSVGIVSASVFVGLLSKSVKAGFRTLVVLICALCCSAIGSGGVYIVKKIFHMSITEAKSLIVGGTGGLIGGVLLGLIISKVMLYLLQYFKQKAGIA